ncbi:MAG: hypothetical protein AAF799_40635 [Myxococcota bacterium]
MLGISVTSWSVALGLVLVGPTSEITSETSRPLERGGNVADARPEITSERAADSARRAEPMSGRVEPDAAIEAEAPSETTAVLEADATPEAEGTPDAEPTAEAQPDADTAVAEPTSEGEPSPAEPATDAESDQGEPEVADEADAASDEPDGEDEDLFGDDADDEPWPDDEPVEDDVGPEVADDYDPLRDSPQALRARHWVRGGIVVMSSGGALLVGAILLGNSDPCNRAVGNSCQEEARNRAAVTIGIPAAALIIGGATALGIGLKQRRQIAVDLQASRDHFGLSVRGRF